MHAGTRLQVQAVFLPPIRASKDEGTHFLSVRLAQPFPPKRERHLVRCQTPVERSETRIMALRGIPDQLVEPMLDALLQIREFCNVFFCREILAFLAEIARQELADQQAERKGYLAAVKRYWNDWKTWAEART